MRRALAGFLKRARLYHDDSVLLGSVIQQEALLADGFALHFWHRHPVHGEPDILVVGPRFAIVIEVKNYAGISGESQLHRYHSLLEEGYNDRPLRHVVYLTRDLSVPALGKEATAGLEDSLWWLSWHELGEVFAEMSELDATGGEMQKDLVNLLDRYALGIFRGMSPWGGEPLDQVFWDDSIMLISDYDKHPESGYYFWQEYTV
jgi:hypothetical protein